MLSEINYKWMSISILSGTILAGIIYLANFHHQLPIFTWLYYVPFGDKIIHFLFIGGIAFFLNKTLNWKTIRVLKFQLYLGSIFIGVLAFGEELSQAFIPSRNLDFFDLLFDFLGIYFFSRFK